MALDYNKLQNFSKNLQGDISKMTREEKDRNAQVRKEVLSILQPIMAQMVSIAKLNKQEMIDIAKSIKVEIPNITVNPQADVNIPEIRLPQINVPEPRVTVNVPKIDAPDVIMPSRMTVGGEVSLVGVDSKRGLPVKMIDKYGNDVDLAGALSQMVNGVSTGGKADFFTIKNILTSSGASLIDQVDGALKVTGALSASLSLDYRSGEIGDYTPRFVQATDAISSVNVVDAFGSTAVNSVFNADNRLRVSVETGGSGLTDAELRASSVPVEQVSGSIWSTYLTGATGSIAVYNLDGDGVYRDVFPVEGTVSVSGSIDSVGAYLLNGDGNHSTVLDDILSSILPDGHNVTVDNGAGGAAVNIQDGGNTITVDGTVGVSGITASVAANIIDSSGVAYSGSNPVPVSDAGGSLTVDGTVAVSGITATIAANIVDSSGIAYTTTNPLPINDAGGAITVDGTVAVSGLTGSIVVIGEIVSDAADTGNAPIKIGGIARTANPAAVAGGDRVSASFDDLGRQLIRPVQVRDLMATAYISLSTGTETTLLAGVASTFQDLVYVMGANQSDAAVLVDFRCGTAGAVVLSLEIPANGTAGIACPVPLPMPEAAQSWTADMDDITGTVVDITALFSKEV